MENQHDMCDMGETIDMNYMGETTMVWCVGFLSKVHFSHYKRGGMAAIPFIPTKPFIQASKTRQERLRESL